MTGKGHQQLLDALGLLGGCLAGDGSVGCVDNGLVQALVAAVGVVALLAAVVCLDD